MVLWWLIPFHSFLIQKYKDAEFSFSRHLYFLMNSLVFVSYIFWVGRFFLTIFCVSISLMFLCLFVQYLIRNSWLSWVCTESFSYFTFWCVLFRFSFSFHLVYLWLFCIFPFVISKNYAPFVCRIFPCVLF